MVIFRFLLYFDGFSFPVRLDSFVNELYGESFDDGAPPWLDSLVLDGVHDAPHGCGCNGFADIGKEGGVDEFDPDSG